MKSGAGQTKKNVKRKGSRRKAHVNSPDLQPHIVPVNLTLPTSEDEVCRVHASRRCRLGQG